MDKNQVKKYEELMDRYYDLEKEIYGDDNLRLGKNTNDNYRYAYSRFLRGETLRNALKEGSDGAGGYLVTDEFEKKLQKGLEDENVLRRIGNVVYSSNDLKIPRVDEKGTATWIDEEGKFNESDISFNQTVIRAYKVGTAIRLSDELLEDAAFDIEDYMIKEFARRIGTAEEETFLTGDGVNKPLGLLNYAVVGASTETLNLDSVIDLYYSVKERHRNNAVWLMNDSTLHHLNKELRAYGRKVWNNNVARSDEPIRLLDRPVFISNAMPGTETGKCPILFGDFSYYWIAERGRYSLKRLSELYATNGQVGFLASKRVDAKLVLPEAIKTLKIV